MRPELEELESYGSFLFHGSKTSGIKRFEPHQAFSFDEPDGPPAIFASEKIDPTIFIAVFGSRENVGWRNNSSGSEGFFVVQSVWNVAADEDWTGAVYVFDKSGFGQDHAWQWRSLKPQTPIHEFTVGMEDLPKDIKVVSDSEIGNYTQRPSNSV